MARSTFSYAKTIKGSNVDFEWEVVPVPKGPAANAPVITGFAYYCVTTNSKNPELAAELVKHMTTTDMMKTMVNTFVAPRASLLNSEEFLQQEGGKPTWVFQDSGFHTRHNHGCCLGYSVEIHLSDRQWPG